MLLGQQQSRRDHRTRGATALVARGRADTDSANGTSRDQSTLEIELVHQVIGAHEAFEFGVGRTRTAETEKCRSSGQRGGRHVARTILRVIERVASENTCGKPAGSLNPGSN